MALSLLESLRRLIRQDISTLGMPVGNFHGAVAGTLEVTSVASTQSWLVLLINGNRALSLADFFQDYDISAVNNTSIQSANNGIVTVPIAAGKVALLRSVVTVARAQMATVTLTLDQTSTASVYLDGVLQRTVEGAATTAVFGVPLSLTPGQHTVAVLVNGSSITLQVPSTLEFSGLVEQLTTPQWRRVTSGYLDEQNGTLVNTLEWVSDAQVGGYRVLRRIVANIGDVSVAGDGEILEIGPLDASNRFVITLQNDHTAALTSGMPLIVNTKTIGIVVSATLDDNGDTNVRCRLPGQLTEPDTSVIGQYCYTGQLLEIARVLSEITASVITYQDSTVTSGTDYEYALQAIGMLDASMLSLVSDRVFVRAGDMMPPGAITITSGYPTVLNKQATVRFVTPADRDYQGVRVYYRSAITNNNTPFTVASIASLTVTIQGTTALPMSLAGYFVRFGTDQTSYAINARTGNFTFTVFNAPGTIAAGTTLTIYKDTLVKTDMGSPDRNDEFTFDLTNYGEYYFSSFDRSNNEQGYIQTVKWTYSQAADTFSGPPVLAIRQLSDAEQAMFNQTVNVATTSGSTTATVASTANLRAGMTLSGNANIPTPTSIVSITNSTTVVLSSEATGTGTTSTTFAYSSVTFAIVEVFAYDPQQPAATKTDGVTLSYQKEGEIVRDLTSITGTFPTTLSGIPTTDNPPSGTRTRYIAINRSAPTLRLWATNSLNLQSDVTTYVADHDTIPAITSLETQVNPAEDTVTFTVVVDDDTACVEWSVDGGNATLLNTSVNKRISNNPLVNPITLALGQLKTLTVVPYSVDVTGMTTVEKAAKAGPAVSRELVRTPRSFVQVENKDADGVRSVEWATLTFSMSPTPTAKVTGRTGTVSVVSGVTRITDAGAPGWTTDQYKSGLTAAYFARVTAAGRAPELRRIVSNTGTMLSLEGQLSVTSGSVNFEIWDGAVLVRKVPGATVFLPTTGSVTESRSSDFTYEFYAHYNGSYRESTRSVVVDADNLPELTNFRYDYNSTTKVLAVRFDSADDDSTYWEVYERKGGWPNSTSATPGTTPTTVTELLPQYLRFSGGVERNSYARNLEGINSGTWYAVAVPKNSFGEPGPLSTASINLGTYTPPKQLTDLTLSPTLNTQNLNIAVTSANTVSSDQVNFTLQRLDSQASLTTVSKTLSQLPFNFDIGETIVASGTVGANTRDWQVTAVLNVVGGNTITKTAKFKTAVPADTITLSGVSASVTDPGSCDTYCYSFGSSPHRRQILWSVSVNGNAATAASPYYVNIDVATDSAGTSFVSLAEGLPAYFGSYLDETNCIYQVAEGGMMAYWTYRITVVDANQQSLSPAKTATSSQIVQRVAFCRGDVF